MFSKQHVTLWLFKVDTLLPFLLAYFSWTFCHDREEVYPQAIWEDFPPPAFSLSCLGQRNELVTNSTASRKMLVHVLLQFTGNWDLLVISEWHPFYHLSNVAQLVLFPSHLFRKQHETLWLFKVDTLLPFLLAYFSWTFCHDREEAYPQAIWEDFPPRL